MITDGYGNVVERRSYDTWGKQRKISWRSSSVTSILQPAITNRGYTGHEEITEVGLIHMNGRVYDQELGRFISADPLIQAPFLVNSFNRYSYVLNNPLKYTDPTGYYSWSEFKSDVKSAWDSFKSIFSGNKKGSGKPKGNGKNSNNEPDSSSDSNPKSVDEKKEKSGVIGETIEADKGSLLQDELVQSAVIAGAYYLGNPELAKEALNISEEQLADLKVTEQNIRLAATILSVYTKKAPKIKTYSDLNVPKSKPSPKPGSAEGPGAGKAFSQNTQDQARTEADNQCVFCGTETIRSKKPHPQRSNIDHAIPKSRGGNNTLDNAQNTCQSCNLDKRTMTTEEYLNKLNSGG